MSCPLLSAYPERLGDWAVGREIGQEVLGGCMKMTFLRGDGELGLKLINRISNLLSGN
jgi:hypothetical protein